MFILKFNDWILAEKGYFSKKKCIKNIFFKALGGCEFFFKMASFFPSPGQGKRCQCVRRQIEQILRK